MAYYVNQNAQPTSAGFFSEPNYNTYQPPADLAFASPTSYVQGLASAPTPSMTPTTDYSGIAGAGIGAAASTATAIMQSLAANAARQRAMEQSGLDRESSTQLAKMKLAAAAAAADKERKFQAQQFLLQALAGGGRNALQAQDNNRAANKMGSSLISDAFARR